MTAAWETFSFGGAISVARGHFDEGCGYWMGELKSVHSKISMKAPNVVSNS